MAYKNFTFVISEKNKSSGVVGEFSVCAKDLQEAEKEFSKYKEVYNSDDFNCRLAMVSA